MSPSSRRTTPGTVQVPRDGATQFENLDALIVVGAEELCGELLPAAALIAREDHGSLDGLMRSVADKGWG